MTAVLSIVSVPALTTEAAYAEITDCGDKKWEVGCEGDKEERGDGEEDSDSDGDDGNTSEPSKGDTWEEVRYTLCVLPGEEHPDEGVGDSCWSGEADTCDNGEKYYWPDVRTWTYNGSEWEYDDSISDDDGWVPGDPGCFDPDEVEEDEEVTEDVVIRAFNARPMPTGEVGANPPNGRTLVNLDTIFYTDQGQEEFDLPLHEINQVVQIIATPTSYNWDFGAGKDSFDTKGKAWEEGLAMSEYNTYTYTETGTFDVQLTIDYEVQFNDGDGWQTISEPITSQPSDPYEVQVLEKRNRLGNGN